MYIYKILLVPGLFVCLVTTRAAEKDDGEIKLHTTTASGYIEKKRCRPECTYSAECSKDKACINQKCQDPCTELCGLNSDCLVINHSLICRCKLEYTGDPFTICSPIPTPVANSEVEPYNPCLPSPCGPNAICQDIGNVPSCACIPSYIGSPPNCRPECTINTECPTSLACIQQKCQDPCVGYCGINALCLVFKNIPVCTCPKGFTGDPFTSCASPQSASSEQDIYNPLVFDYPAIDAEPVPPFEVYRSHGSWGAPASIGGHQLAPHGHPMVWHVGVYSKLFTPYMQICGGTLVTTKAVISAAHCFWNDVEGAMSARNFGVGAGKRYRPWDEPQDQYAQTSDVEAIHLPVRYRDAATSYQEDIAVLLLSKEFSISLAVRPACVDFDEDFDNQQLREGNRGTVLGWGLTKEDGDPSPILNYLELPAVSIEECVRQADLDFLRYITTDKICAGVTTGKALCRGDSGGGLVFTEKVDSMPVPYLRGVASTAPRNEHRCNAYALAALTHVRAHRAFLLRYIPDLEAECQKHYPVVNDLNNRYSSNEPGTCQPVQVTCNCVCNNTNT